jgi:hypothetical protein
MLAGPQDSAPPTVTEGESDESLGSGSTRAAAPRRLPPRVPASAAVPDGPTRANGEARAQSSAAVLDIMRRAVATPPKGNRSPESQANEISGQLAGIIRSIRTTEPEVLSTLREQLADEACAGRFYSDMSLILFAKMTTFESRLGSPRALGCAFEGRRHEDVVLWSLLDAWNIAGRPDLPAVSEIQQNARDERTRTRLLSRDANRARAAWNRYPPADPAERQASETNDVQRAHDVNEGRAAGATGR